MKQSSASNSILGHWRIVWMEEWDQEYVDLVEPGYVRINSEGSGEFQFGVVTGYFRVNPEKTHFDSTWEGSQECDESEYRAIRLTSPEKMRNSE